MPPNMVIALMRGPEVEELRDMLLLLDARCLAGNGFELVKNPFAMQVKLQMV